MNILLLSWRDLKHPNAGGAEQVTFEHAKGWVAGGHNVWWFSSSFDGYKTKETFENITFVRRGRQTLGVHILAFFWYVFGKHPRFDLVVDQFHGIPFFTPLYVRAKKIAYIHEVTGEAVWKLNPWPRPFNLIPWVVGTICEPIVFKLFYTRIPFMTVSNSTKKNLVELGIPEYNIRVIPNGVLLDALPSRLPQKEKKKTVVYLGALSADKGIIDALRVFGEMHRLDGDWQYWVIGRGSKEYTDKLHSMSADLGISKNIKYWGFVGDEKKFELLARAHIMVNPSVREGWGLVNIEANAVGTPVIGYNVLGTKDSIVDGRTGLLVESGDYKQLARAILDLTNRSEYLTFRRNALEWSKRFTWDQAKDRSLKFINSL